MPPTKTKLGEFETCDNFCISSNNFLVELFSYRSNIYIFSFITHLEANQSKFWSFRIMNMDIFFELKDLKVIYFSVVKAIY